MKILLTETDEANMISTGELISKLAEWDIVAERKTIYADIEALQHYGLDIVMEKRKTFGYYIANRDFELPELKLLADAVQSSKFITERKSMQLIKKLENLVSKHDAGKLRRQIYIQNRVKSMNESIYYNVDTLHDAINEGKKVSFKYFDFNVKKEQVYRKDGEFYKMSPAALSWTDEHYYLIACSDERNGIVHLRVDRMTNVKVLDEPRNEASKSFKLADYSKKVFSMFGGEEANVKLRVHNKLIGPIIDRFGKDITMIPDGEDYFTIRVQVVLSPVFYGWIFQFGDMCEVIEPKGLIDEMTKRARELLERHNET